MEFSVNAGTAIGAIALDKETLYLLGEELVCLFSLAGLSLLPTGVTTARDFQGTTESDKRELPLILLYELVSYLGALVKIPTAFFRISTSSFRRAFSR